jgi:DNA (cytosine-5)-methyltransferase 1
MVMASRENTYAVNLVRGPFVRLPPHPATFEQEDEDTFLDWASSRPAPTAIDLFCGAGGLSLGLHNSGYEVILGVDHDEEALETHRSLFPGMSVNWDLSDDDVVEHIIRIARRTNVELVAGGPPCQPFSKAGRSMIRDLVRNGRRHEKDERRDLWESFIAIVEGVRPKAVLMENVPDMALDRDMQILRTMVDILEELKYSVEVRVLDSSRFEVPQPRPRLILVALADGITFTWPSESGYQVTLRSAIGDLPYVDGGWRPEAGAEGWIEYKKPLSEFQTRARRLVPDGQRHRVFDHITRPVREDDQIIFSAMDSTTSYADIDHAIAALDRVSPGESAVREGSFKRYRDDIFDDKYKRLDWNQLSRTITAHIAKDGYGFIHPEQDRTLTIREAARIQTFPDDVRFAGPPSAAFRQIGNAVPPRLGELLGKQILASLERSTGGSHPTRVVARNLAAWFEIREAEGTLRYPWLSAPDRTGKRGLRTARWKVIQAEILLGRIRADSARTLWPILAKLDSPGDTVSNDTQLREMAGWVDRTTHASKVLEAAAYFADNPADFDTVDGMRQAPHVTESIAELAARVAPGPDEDPVLVTKGVLRVAARHSGTSVNRRNLLSDGRIALARLIGAEDETSDHAFLALIELADTLCGPGRPTCPECPLRKTCASTRTL